MLCTSHALFKGTLVHCHLNTFVTISIPPVRWPVGSRVNLSSVGLVEETDVWFRMKFCAFHFYNLMIDNWNYANNNVISIWLYTLPSYTFFDFSFSNQCQIIWEYRGDFNLISTKDANLNFTMWVCWQLSQNDTRNSKFWRSFTYSKEKWRLYLLFTFCSSYVSVLP